MVRDTPSFGGSSTRLTQQDEQERRCSGIYRGCCPLCGTPLEWRAVRMPCGKDPVPIMTGFGFCATCQGIPVLCMNCTRAWEVDRNQTLICAHCGKRPHVVTIRTAPVLDGR